MLYLIRHSICVFLFLSLSTAFLKSSAALVETMQVQDSGPSDQCKRLKSLSPQQQYWLQLVENKQFELAIATIDPQIHCPYEFSLDIIATENPDLVGAYAEKICPHFDRDMWHYLFRQAAKAGRINTCKILWELRRLNKYGPMQSLITALVESSISGNQEFVTWALMILKQSNALGLINTMRAMLIREKKSRKQGSGQIITEHYYWHPIGPAACNNHRNIVITLLQHGADPTIEAGDMSALRYARTYRHNGMTSFLESFTFLQPRILDFVRNSTPQKPTERAIPDENTVQQRGYNNHLKAVRALFQCPAVVSEYITDAQGNNVAHLAVLAQNPLLITLSLIANPTLITSRNACNLTPLDLAYSKGFIESLNAILKLYYRVQKATHADELISDCLNKI